MSVAPPKRVKTRKRKRVRKDPRGRPSKMTDACIEKIVNAIRIGNSFERAARLSGVGERTFHTWMERGKTHRKTRFQQFRQRVELAVDESINAKLVRMHMIAITPGPSSFEACKYFLKLRAPEEWGDGQNAELIRENEELRARIAAPSSEDPSRHVVQVFYHPSVQPTPEQEANGTRTPDGLLRVGEPPKRQTSDGPAARPKEKK